MRTIYTVTPNDGAWAVVWKRQAVYRSKTKLEAVAKGRKMCRDLLADGVLSQLRIKGRDGRVQTEHTYGDDPRRHVG